MPDRRTGAPLTRDDLSRGNRQGVDNRIPPNIMPTRPILAPTRPQPEATQAQPEVAQPEVDTTDAAVTTISEADQVFDIALRIAQDGDLARLRAGAELLNTFNYAIQVQAKRQYWNASDYRAFVIALAAMDGIGQEAVATAQTDNRAEEVERELEKNRQGR